MKIDPGVFISPPYLKCPRCGHEKYGILMILEQSYIRRCANCFRPTGYESADRFDLPPVSKKIVYLDQFAISEMVKAKKEPGTRKEWHELYSLIDGLALDQVIVCPDSHYHEKESELFVSLAKEFKDFYIKISRGISFCHPHQIESRQIYQALKKFIGEDASKDYDFSYYSDALSKDPNAWHAKFHIRVNLWNDPSEISRLRSTKEEYLKIKKEHFEGLPDKKEFDFYKEVRIWQDARANAILQLYGKYVIEYLKMCSGLKPFDPMWFLNSPTATESAEQILHFFEGKGISNRIEQIDKMRDFLYSDYFFNMPNILIGSLFDAGISRKYVMGARKEPKSGDFYDSQIISHLLPYCDAMFIDNESRAILTEEPIRSEIKQRFKTRLFSKSTCNDFIKYLRELESQMSPALRNAVKEVYGKIYTPPKE